MKVIVIRLPRERVKVTTTVFAPPAGNQQEAAGRTAGKGQGNGEGLQVVWQEIQQLVGLVEVKKTLWEIYALAEINKKRRQEKLATPNQAWHMIFKGNPGTGKTTVARLLGRFFKELGILSRGHVVEVERADLVGEYIGHTAQKTREQLKRALGGILFVDEAYSLARGGERDFGKEAIDVLVKGMEDERENFILILAGYLHEMEYFLGTNPGLRSRFPFILTFPDYSLNELLAIADLMLKQREYVLEPAAREELRRVLAAKINGHPYSGNARLVRNLIEQAVRRHAVRLLSLSHPSREDLMLIKKDDIISGEKEEWLSFCR